VQSRKKPFHVGRATAHADATTFDEDGVITGGLLGPDRVIRIVSRDRKGKR
jgi:hypothetical protein